MRSCRNNSMIIDYNIVKIDKITLTYYTKIVYNYDGTQF